jgi:hypothetical protein
VARGGLLPGLLALLQPARVASAGLAQGCSTGAAVWAADSACNARPPGPQEWQALLEELLPLPARQERGGRPELGERAGEEGVDGALRDAQAGISAQLLLLLLLLMMMMMLMMLMLLMAPPAGRGLCHSRRWPGSCLPGYMGGLWG